MDLFLRWRGGALEALDTAAQRDPSFALAHCTRAWIAWRMGRVDLAEAAAKQAAARADEAHDEREREHVQAVAAMQRGDALAAYARLGQVAARHPTDRIAVRIVGLHCITQGDYRGGIDIARRSLAADPGEPQFQTMLGFFLEQSGAVGHAYQARGDYPRALETFERAASLERYPHVLWHKAWAQVARLRRLPEGRASGHWSTLGASLLEGELALVEGDHATAAWLMAPAVEQIHAMGGGSWPSSACSPICTTSSRSRRSPGPTSVAATPRCNGRRVASSCGGPRTLPSLRTRPSCWPRAGRSRSPPDPA